MRQTDGSMVYWVPRDQAGCLVGYQVAMRTCRQGKVMVVVAAAAAVATANDANRLVEAKMLKTACSFGTQRHKPKP
jgi:hypothetical protein